MCGSPLQRAVIISLGRKSSGPQSSGTPLKVLVPTCYQRRREAHYDAGRPATTNRTFRSASLPLLAAGINRCVGRRGVSHGCGSSGTFVPSCPRCFCTHSPQCTAWVQILSQPRATWHPQVKYLPMPFAFVCTRQWEPALDLAPSTAVRMLWVSTGDNSARRPVPVKAAGVFSFVISEVSSGLLPFTLGVH